MAENNNNILGGYLEIFKKLSMQQKMFIGGIFVVMIVLLGFVFLVVNEPNYTTLYSNLSVQDASKVVEHLNGANIPYKLENNESTIKIPSDKLHESRLALASKGIPSTGIIGYEVFDKNTMGMSDFMQKLNYKRALEGEISKTIMQQKDISGARVHIVVPKKAIFKEDQEEPSASVVLKTRSSSGISQNSIMAIKHLVSSSVEGLKPGRVTIVDTEGQLLSEVEEQNSLIVKSGKQYEIKGKVESYLADKAQSILDNVLGYGNSIVKVNVDLNFKQVERTMEMFDPESQIAISEQTIKQESGGTTISDSTLVSSENTTTNYELSKTIEKVVEDAGNIRRITVAAVINGVKKEVQNDDGKTETVVEPRNDEQLRQLEQIIRQSVGVDEKRNDNVEVVSIPFETEQYEEQIVEASPINDFDDWSNLVLIVVAIGAALIVLKGLMTKLKNEKIIVGTVDYEDDSFKDLSLGSGKKSSGQNMKNRLKESKRELLNVGDIEEEITEAAQAKKIKKEKIINYVSKNPSEAAKLINSWLREDEY